MKLKFLYIISTIGLLAFGSCSDEVTITNGASQDQIDASNKAKEAMVYSLPALNKKFQTLTNATYHYDWGYGSIMHIRDVMTGDLSVIPSGYDWYDGWSTNEDQGESTAMSRFIWNYFYQYNLTANLLIQSIDKNTTNANEQSYLGVGLTYRAFIYLDLARMYEFLANDKTSNINSDGNDVLNLTVPIIKDGMTESESRENPRATRTEMYDFIISDLDKAETLIANYSRPTKNLPNLAVVYGLKARLYMWVENYAKAQEYARKAIDQSGATPMSESEWTDKTTGFNTLSVSSWMWGTQLTSQDDIVKTGIINWTSWLSPEALFGYSAADPTSMIDVSLYNQIADTDFRKYSFVAPEGSAVADKVSFLDDEWGAKLVTYAGIKFRPNNGNMDIYQTGAASAYPLMRVEEMYLIEAEAAAQQSPATGKTLLVNFMTSYRDDSYTFSGTSKEAVVNEIFLQKRIEFWGEGVTFFDYKRLNKPVTRGYAGTNFSVDRSFNTTTRPAWMNLVITQDEGNNNNGVLKYNNPDPSGKYIPWVAPK